MTSGSYLHGPGRGEAMFWFAYTTPVRIDTIRLWAEEDGTRRSPATLDVPVDVAWTGERSSVVRARPEWVEGMRAEGERRARAEYEAYMSRPTPWWQTVLFFALIWSIP